MPLPLPPPELDADGDEAASRVRMSVVVPETSRDLPRLPNPWGALDEEEDVSGDFEGAFEALRGPRGEATRR